MPVELATLEARCTLTGTGYPALEVLAQVSPDGPGVYEADVYVDAEDVYEEMSEGDFNLATVGFDASITDSPMDLLNPTNGQQLVGPLRITPSGDFIDPFIIAWSSWYEENERGQQFGWQSDRGVMGGVYPLGGGRTEYNSGQQPETYNVYPGLAAAMGNPYGGAVWEVNAQVVPNVASASAVRRIIPLLSSGVAENSGDVFGLPDVRNFVGVGPLARYSTRSVTFQLPRGHGWTRGKMVTEILKQMGVPAGQIAVGGSDRLYGEVTILNRNGYQAIAEILLPELLELYRDEQAVFRTRSLVPYDLPVSLTIRDVMRGSITEQATTEGPTRIKLRGTRQILRDDVGTVTEDLPPVTTELIYAPVVAAKKQDGSGVISASGGTQGPASLIVFSRVEKSVTREGDTVLAERTKTYGWKNPLAWRYELDTSGAITSYNPNVYMNETGTVTDDGNQAHLWLSERFVLLTDELVRYIYDERGYLTGTVTTLDAWNLPRVAIKQRTSLGDPWDAQPFVGGLKVLANLEGVAKTATFPGFEFMSQFNAGATGTPYNAPYSRQTLSYSITEAENEAGVLSGYRTQDKTESESWSHRGGGLYLYAQGDTRESTDPFDQVRLAERQTVDYVAEKTGGHTILLQKVDANGQLIERDTSGGDGYLPAATRRADLTPDPALYPQGSPASKYEQQDIETEVRATVLETYRDRQEPEQPEFVPYAESLEALQRVGWYRIREGAKSQVNATMSFCPWLKRGMRVVLFVRGMVWDLIVRRVRHPAGRTAVTVLTGDTYFL